MEAEILVMGQQAEDTKYCQQSPEAGKSQGWIYV